MLCTGWCDEFLNRTQSWWGWSVLDAHNEILFYLIYSVIPRNILTIYCLISFFFHDSYRSVPENTGHNHSSGWQRGNQELIGTRTKRCSRTSCQAEDSLGKASSRKGWLYCFNPSNASENMLAQIQDWSADISMHWSTTPSAPRHGYISMHTFTCLYTLWPSMVSPASCIFMQSCYIRTRENLFLVYRRNDWYDERNTCYE